MKNGHEESGHFQQWEKLYKDALFESEVLKMPQRLELAKHAVLDRLEDVTCTRKKQTYQAQELEALRDAHRALKALEQLYFTDSYDNRIG
jgi:hypothetical protein